MIFQPVIQTYDSLLFMSTMQFLKIKPNIFIANLPKLFVHTVTMETIYKPTKGYYVESQRVCLCKYWFCLFIYF